MQSVVEELQSAIDEARKLAHVEFPVAADVAQAQELIAFAHRLSFTTAAPPGFIPGETPLGLFKPPAPQDVQLRSSMLHQLQSERQLSQPPAPNDCCPCFRKFLENLRRMI